MENADDLRVAAQGMVTATVTEVVGADAVQEFDIQVTTDGSEREVEPHVAIVLAYRGRSAHRVVRLRDLSTRTDLETRMSNEVVPMLQEMGLLPRGEPDRQE